MISLRLFTGGKPGSRMFRDAVPAQQPHLQPLFPSVFGVVGKYKDPEPLQRATSGAAGREKGVLNAFR